MKIVSIAAVGAAAVLGLGSLSAVSLAAEPAGPAGELKPAQDVIEQLEREYRGKVIEFELDRELTGDYYEVELVDQENREWDIEVDARTGEVKQRREDRD